MLFQFHTIESFRSAVTVIQYCVPAVRVGVNAEFRTTSGLFEPFAPSDVPATVKLSSTEAGVSLLLEVSATVNVSKQPKAAPGDFEGGEEKVAQLSAMSRLLNLELNVGVNVSASA